MSCAVWDMELGTKAPPHCKFYSSRSQVDNKRTYWGSSVCGVMCIGVVPADDAIVCTFEGGQWCVMLFFFLFMMLLLLWLTEDVGERGYGQRQIGWCTHYGKALSTSEEALRSNIEVSGLTCHMLCGTFHRRLLALFITEDSNRATSLLI